MTMSIRISGDAMPELSEGISVDAYRRKSGQTRGGIAQGLNKVQSRAKCRLPQPWRGGWRHRQLIANVCRSAAAWGGHRARPRPC